MESIRTVSEFNALENVEKCVVKVSAPWCGPCKALKPIAEAVEQETNIQFYDIDVDECDEELTELLNIKGVPVLILLENGEEQNRLIGFATKDKVLELVK